MHRENHQWVIKNATHHEFLRDPGLNDSINNFTPKIDEAYKFDTKSEAQFISQDVRTNRYGNHAQWIAVPDHWWEVTASVPMNHGYKLYHITHDLKMVEQGYTSRNNRPIIYWSRAEAEATVRKLEQHYRTTPNTTFNISRGKEPDEN